jgi:SRSO17 transposase
MMLDHPPAVLPQGASRTTEAARPDPFDDYTAAFQDVFPRADQFRRFQAYLRGLLGPGARKNLGGIAAGSADPVADLAQALQHFVSQSPWDADRLLAGYRRAAAARLADPAATWVVHEGAFPKRGRHSVGVQRQFARSLARKLNCQLAVAVSQVGPAGYFPLAVRLYLPAHWLREHQDGAAQGVPEEFRRPATKVDIALGLLDELRAAGQRPAGVLAEEGYATAEFQSGLAARELARVAAGGGPAGRWLSEVQRRFDWLKAALGLDHFEGRTWTGWHHHASLVFAAYGFLALTGFGPDQPPFPSHR